MLRPFLVANRLEILALSRSKLAARHVPLPTQSELAKGLPLFLDQLITILGQGTDDRAAGYRAVAVSASLRGGELLRMGLTVGQVVQDYGSVCQSVTEIAAASDVTISAKEFQIFNRCLDDAVAQAVTEYEHQRDRKDGGPGVEQLAELVHEMRNMVTTSLLTYDALQEGAVGIHGNTSELLGQSLRRMSALLDRTLSSVRVGTGKMHLERVPVAEMLQELRVVASLEAKALAVTLAVDVGSPDVFVEVDRQIFSSALANLVQNALKFTRPRSSVSVRAVTSGDRVYIEVEDECGGLPQGRADELFLPFEQRGGDQTGLGLGLSISQKSMRACGGEIRVRDQPAKGCVFTIDLPRAAEAPLPS